LSTVPWVLALSGVLIACAPPARAACTGADCQATHSASSNQPGDVLNGCCKSGTSTGSEPDWQQITSCDDDWYFEKNWTRRLTNLAHNDTNCTDTTDSCTLVPPEYEVCGTPPIVEVTKSRHRLEDDNGVPYYDHTWTDGTPVIACQCNKHGCDQ
jgi:hypothetical protein